MSGGAVAGMAVLAGVLHAQVHGGSGEGLGQGDRLGEVHGDGIELAEQPPL